MDQLLGHGKTMEGDLNAEEISVRYSRSQQKMRNTTIIGTYPAQLQVNNIQLLFMTHLGEEVLRFCQQKVSNGAPLPSAISQGRAKSPDAHPPKYHCKVAGEGIKFIWGMLK